MEDDLIQLTYKSIFAEPYGWASTGQFRHVLRQR